ncbi:MAG: amylo-alpha-1,6-glucosidase, partial [Bacteroidota bacterium]
KAFEFHIRLQLSYRNHHALFRESAEYSFHRAEKEGTQVFYPSFQPEGLYFKQSSGVFIEDRYWNKNLRYHREEMRGQDFEEDSFSPGYAHVQIAAGEKVWLTFSLEEKQMKLDPESALKKEVKRQRKLIRPFPKQSFLQDLIKAGDQFLVDRASTQAKTILAGYHWFTDWGRDTMIAMRGLTIATGKQEISRQIFDTFFQYLDQGMLPNRFFDEGEEAEYNTVDATLWLFVALYEYVQKFGDWEYIASIMPQLQSIVAAYSDGTRYNIHSTQEGFIFAGDSKSQLTWMDARIWGHTVTPRWGCPVEINALWYNALKIFQQFGEKLGFESETYQKHLRGIEENFLPYFLNEKGYLHDVILPGEGADDSMRPNQLYALSLPFPLVDRKTGKSILSQVKKALYTPLGMRTLSPDHPDFKSTYGGGPWERDTAYHQGTVWPFLLGAYFEAFLWVENHSSKAKKAVEEELQVIQQHFYEEGCIEGISEIFDGLNPHADLGKGTAHQAWSVSVLIELILKHNLLCSCR